MVLSLFFLASIEAPIFEETLFRGIFQPALAAIVKRPWLSGVITSFLFASIHPTGVPAWPALALIGGMSVFLTYQTRSIVPSMIMHATHNALTLAVGLLLT
jgi:membrane protease YdiL (CAAX protease family)